MNDLISKQALIKAFELQNSAYNPHDLWHITGIKSFIENEPTAYDVIDRNVDKFAEELKQRLTDAIHQKDVESMTNLINDVAREIKTGSNKCYARACDHNNIDNTCMYGDASERRCCVKAN